MKDLRTFLSDIEHAEGRVREVTRPVSRDRELAAIVRLLEDRGNPIVYFTDVQDSDFPVIVGVHGTRQRIALAMGTTVEMAVEEFLTRLDGGRAIAWQDNGPVMDVCDTGDDVDLGKLPIPTHAEKDAGPFLTASVVIARDAETGLINTGINRMMVVDRNHVTVRSRSGTDLGTIIERAHAEEKSVEIAVSVGHHPAFQIASQAKIPRSLDSLEVAGAILGEPLSVVRATTVDLPIPAASEIVLEGRTVPGATRPDGPFGESSLYYDSAWGYLLEVTAISHRHDAIYLDINPVHREHTCLSVFPAREAQLLAKLRETYPHVRAVRIPSRTAGMHAHISVDPQNDGEAKQILMVGLGAIPRLKHAIAVNTDVDIFDDESVLWALATRFQGDRDLIVVPYVSGLAMDPSSYGMSARYDGGSVRTQVGFDATMPVGVSFRERADRVGPEFSALDVGALLTARDRSYRTPWRSCQSYA